MDFQVRKGLETPLKVHGMRTKFFCIYCIILAVIVLFVVGFLTSAMSGEIQAGICDRGGGLYTDGRKEVFRRTGIPASLLHIVLYAFGTAKP